MLAVFRGLKPSLCSPCMCGKTTSKIQSVILRTYMRPAPYNIRVYFCAQSRQPAVGLWLRGVSDSNGRDPGFNSRHLEHFTFVAFSGTNSCNKHEKGAQACFTCGSDKYWYISSNLVNMALIFDPFQHSLRYRRREAVCRLVSLRASGAPANVLSGNGFLWNIWNI